jgi:hypothetical protein
VSWEMAQTESLLADSLVGKVKRRLCPSAWPLWVSDGFGAYREALLNHYADSSYPKGCMPDPRLRYGQLRKVRAADRVIVTGVHPTAIFGDVDPAEISTWCLERENLNVRHDNRRLVRKTIAFSKTARGLADQMTFYQAYSNLVRTHRGLRLVLNNSGGKKWLSRTPAMASELVRRPWSMGRLLRRRLSLN